MASIYIFPLAFLDFSTFDEKISVFIILDYRDKQRELDQLLDHNKRLIADKKAALEEAKANEIRKDKQNIVFEQIKLR